MKQTSSIQNRAWNVKYNFTTAKLTVSSSISFVLYLVPVSGLVGLLESLGGKLKKRRRSATEAQSVWSQACLLSMEDGRLSYMEIPSAEGLGEISGSRRMGEFWLSSL